MEYPSMESEVLWLASPWRLRMFLCSRLLMRPMISFPNFSFLEFVLKNQQVFDLLWCLVCHDIWFVWERSEFLQQAEGQMLTSKPFSVRNIQLHVIKEFIQGMIFQPLVCSFRNYLIEAYIRNPLMIYTWSSLDLFCLIFEVSMIFICLIFFLLCCLIFQVRIVLRGTFVSSSD